MRPDRTGCVAGRFDLGLCRLGSYEEAIADQFFEVCEEKFDGAALVGALPCIGLGNQRGCLG